ncbi:MAG: T9SS type A sorting domain-containing protein, partial [Chitinophagales bacterium]
MLKKLPLAILAILCVLGLNAQRYLTPQFTNVTVTKDVKYGANLGYNSSFTSSEDLMMDVYEPQGDTATHRPVIILGHAGSYLSLYAWGTKEQYSVVELCNRFAKLGYVAVSINYRLGWSAGSSDAETREKTIINAVYRAMQDFKTCIRYFKKDASTVNNWKVDPCKIFVGGTNSGGYSSLAVANLNKQSELLGVKFLDSQGHPYIDQSKTGDFDGFGGTENMDNYPGYTSTARAVLALGAATGDSIWVEPGEIPVVAMSGVDETTTPYNTAIVITGSGTAIIVVSGAGDFMPRQERLGNNDVFKSAMLPAGPPNRNGSGVVTQPVEGLYPFYGAMFEPWSWYDGTQPVGDATLNPSASQVKAMKYIDTIMAYTAPRFFEIIKDNAACTVTTGIQDVKSETGFDFTAVPNPASNTITVFSKDAKEIVEAAQLLDLNGRIVAGVADNRAYYAVLNVNDVANGIYTIAMKTVNGVAVKKVVVQ